MASRLAEHEKRDIQCFSPAGAQATGQPEAIAPPKDGPVVEHPLDKDTESTDGSTPLEVDEINSVLNSKDQISSTASVTSSFYDYIEENGRRYHRFKAGTYMLPNDESEQDRLNLQHHLFMLSLRSRLYLAPIDNIPLHNILDIATGTGIWATEFASAFPSINVLGTDLSQIQPPHIPANCRFEIDDAEDEWVFSNSFDFIHGRALTTCFKDHVPVFRSAFNALRPGGYFEMQDAIIPFRCIDDSMKGSAFERWQMLIKDATTALGRDFRKAVHYKSYSEEVGFVDIVEKQFTCPIGSWAKDPRMKIIGAWTKEDVLSGLHGWSAAVLTRGLGMSSEEVEKLLTEVMSDINSTWLHCYISIVVVYGRKPMPTGISELTIQSKVVEQGAS